MEQTHSCHAGRGRGVKVGRSGAEMGKMEMERDFAWGSGHAMQWADVVLWSCPLEICMVL